MNVGTSKVAYLVFGILTFWLVVNIVIWKVDHDYVQQEMKYEQTSKQLLKVYEQLLQHEEQQNYCKNETHLVQDITQSIELLKVIRNFKKESNKLKNEKEQIKQEYELLKKENKEIIAIFFNFIFFVFKLVIILLLMHL